MRLSDIVKHLSRIFERKRNNPILLEKDTNLESNLKNVKIGNKSTIVNISETELKIRGTINADAINVDGSSVQTGADAGATELNELSDVTYSSGDLTIDSLDTIAAASDLKLDVGGDITLDAAGDQINFDNDGTTFGAIDTSVVGKLRLLGTSNNQVIIESQGTGDVQIVSTDNIIIDATDALTIDTDGTFVMMKDGTEFSAANSAYAGMILGYTSLLNDAADTSYAVTTSFVTIDATAKITFVAPPSGNVEIFASVYVKSTSTRQLYFGLSDNATYNAVDVTHEHEVYIGDETDEETLNHQWVITGLTSGTSYTYFLGAKAAQAGRLSLHWGGDATGEYAPFIMKATALPAALYEG